MKIALFFVYVLVAVMAALVAHRHWRRRTVVRVSLIVSLPIVLGHALFAIVPSLPVWLFDYSVYAAVERELWAPFAVLLFAALSHTIPAKNRRAMVMMAWVLVGLVVYTVSWRLVRPDVYDSPNRAGDGVCMQSEDWTCGPASAVTLLDRMDIDATEGEMAERMSATPRWGVSEYSAAHGLQEKLKDEHNDGVVRVVFCDVDTLQTFKTPMLISVKHNFWFNHMVCLLRFNDGGVTLADPLKGTVRMTSDQFMKNWLKFAVVIDPAGAPQ